MLAAGAMAYVGYQYSEKYEGKILPGSTIAGVDVGGMTEKQARREIRKALQDPAPVRQRRGSDPQFEQMLKKFMKSSEENLVDYKRAVEHKRK